MTTTTWLHDIKKGKSFPTLVKDITTDVVIIGGGLAGILTGYLLVKAGKKVTVIDKGTLADTMTAYTTAFITHVIDTPLVDLESMFGKAKAKKVWLSGIGAIDRIEDIIQKEKIDSEFKRVPEYLYASSKKNTESLMEELEMAKKFGFSNISFCKPGKIALNNFGSLEFRNQAKFHPLKFLVQLRKTIVENGGEIYENTEAEKIIENKTGKKLLTIETKKGIIQARDVVITTYQPFNNPLKLFARKGMYISYVYELSVPKDAIEEGLYMDSENPYHYMRVDSMGKSDRVILGGEDHRKEVPLDPKKPFAALLEYFEKACPGIDYTVVKKWTGGILEPIDGLPYIGRYSKKFAHHFAATAFSGNGMTYSAIAAMIISDGILGKKNPYEKVYAAGRKASLKALGKKALDYGQEFISGAVKNTFRKKRKSKKL